MNPDSKLKGIFDMKMGWLTEPRNKKKFKAVNVRTSKNLADDQTKPVNAVVRNAPDKELHRIQNNIVESFRGHVDI